MVVPPDKGLSREQWARAALDDIAAGGVDTVSVEGLARRLGVTKGSCYWHFADRADLLRTALSLWERTSTLDIIDELNTIAGPRRRLATLFRRSFGDPDGGALDAALLARIDDPLVGPVIERVHAARLGCLEQIFDDLGLSRLRAARQARITYAAYIGHFTLRRAVPDDAHLGRPGRAYLEQLLASVVPAGEAP